MHGIPTPVPEARSYVSGVAQIQPCWVWPLPLACGAVAARNCHQGDSEHGWPSWRHSLTQACFNAAWPCCQSRPQGAWWAGRRAPKCSICPAGNQAGRREGPRPPGLLQRRRQLASSCCRLVMLSAQSAVGWGGRQEGAKTLTLPCWKSSRLTGGLLSSRAAAAASPARIKLPQADDAVRAKSSAYGGKQEGAKTLTLPCWKSRRLTGGPASSRAAAAASWAAGGRLAAEDPLAAAAPLAGSACEAITT